MNKIEPIALHKKVKNKLNNHYKNELLADQYAWWTLEEILEKTKTTLLVEKEIFISDEQKKQIESWIHKLTKENMPIQYLIGYVEFLDLKLFVKSPTLICRPETEELCDFLIAHLKKLANKNITILDIGTGSGCIALSLAKHIPTATIWAVDISKQALELAKKNAAENNIKNVTFLESNIFKRLPADIKFDIIISNPPYITEHAWQNLEKTVKNWEDKGALAAEKDGLAIIEKIILKAPSYLKSNQELLDNKIPNLLLEIGHQQSNAVVNLCKNSGFNNILIKKDMEQKERFILATYQVKKKFEKTNL